MKILIIGSNGQLGTDCISVLKNKHRITPLDYPDIDITSRESVAETFTAAGPEIIINCAAYTAVDACESDREAAWKVNGEGPRIIAEEAKAAGGRVIHISTDYVFDGYKPVPGSYLETDPVNPLSEYGRSKLAGERAVLDILPEAIVLRTAWLYSAHGPNFLKTMLRLALSDPTRAFTIVDDQYGSLTWSYTLALQIERLIDTTLSGIIHTTSDNYSSWFQAACYFLEKMEVAHSFAPCTTADYPTAACRPTNSILENKVLDDNGISVFRSWQEDVDQFVAGNREKLIEETTASLDS